MDITIEEFERAPDFLNFYTFINAMIVRDCVEFSEYNNKVINLNSIASNYFSIGRDENMVPFIGIQEDMMNWFFNLGWAEVSYLINKKESRIFLTSRDEDTDEINFILGIKVRRKRMVVLHDEKSEKLENSFCNLKVIRLEKNNEILISFNNIIANLKINKIKSIDDLIEVQEDDVVNKKDIKLMFLKGKK